MIDLSLLVRVILKSDSPIAIANKLNPNLLELVFLQENKSLNLAEVKYGWDLAAQIDPTKKCCVILKTGEWTLLEKEAAQFAFKEMKAWTSVAVLVHNSAQKILGSVALGIIGQSNKIKIFTNESEAYKWLENKIKVD